MCHVSAQAIPRAALRLAGCRQPRARGSFQERPSHGNHIVPRLYRTPEKELCIPPQLDDSASTSIARTLHHKAGSQHVGHESVRLDLWGHKGVTDWDSSMCDRPLHRNPRGAPDTRQEINECYTRRSLPVAVPKFPPRSPLEVNHPSSVTQGSLKVRATAL